jgi:hypothetical protein
MVSHMRTKKFRIRSRETTCLQLSDSSLSSVPRLIAILSINVRFKERRKVPNRNKIKVKKRKSKKVLSFDNTDSHFICIEDG